MGQHKMGLPTTPASPGTLGPCSGPSRTMFDWVGGPTFERNAPGTLAELRRPPPGQVLRIAENWKVARRCSKVYISSCVAEIGQHEVPKEIVCDTHFEEPAEHSSLAMRMQSSRSEDRFGAKPCKKIGRTWVVGDASHRKSHDDWSEASGRRPVFAPLSTLCAACPSPATFSAPLF